MMQKRIRGVLLGETAALFVGVLLLVLFGYRYGGQVFGTDALMYINTGLQSKADPFILNRYTHVFLIRFFTVLAKNPIQGYRFLSGFLFGLNALLVYLSARTFHRTSSPFNGLLAVTIFLSVPRVVDLLLAPIVDSTAMLVMLAIVAVYIQSVRRNHKHRRWMILFGLLFFFGIKTKETLIVSAALLPGLLLGSSAEIQKGRVRENGLSVLMGFGLGGLLFVILNSIFLRTPFFGFRPGDIRAYLDIWSGIIGSADKLGKTFEGLVLGELGFIFILFLISGVLKRKSLEWDSLLLWSPPILLIAFVLVFSTRTNWMIVPRGFMPGFAVMAVLAGSVVSIRMPKRAEAIKTIFKLIAVGLFLALVGGYGYLRSLDEPFSIYFHAVYTPVILVSVLMLIIFSKDETNFGIPIAIMLLSVSVYSMRLIYYEVSIRPEVTRTNERFQSILPFEDVIEDPEKMFVSEAILPYMAIDNNRDELSVLMNVGLDMKTERYDYTLRIVDALLVSELMNTEYDFALLIESDWEWLRAELQETPAWRNNYQARYESTGRFVLLERTK